MTVPLGTIKSALRIDYDDDDAALARLREAALSLIARRTQLVLTPATQYLYMATWRDTMFPAIPYVSLASVTYQDSSNVTQTLSASDYWIDNTDGPIPILRFLETYDQYRGTVITATYTAGYSTLPNEIIHAVISLVGYWYANPEAGSDTSLSMAPISLEYILDTLSSRSFLR